MKKTLRHHTLLILVLMLCAVFAFPASASAKVKLSKTKVTIAVGKSTTLKLTGTKKKAKWSTSKKKIATVNQKGKITAKAPGTCKITAKVGSKKYTCKVTVQQVTLRVMSSGTPVDTIQAISLKKGKSLTLSIQQGTRTSKKAAYKYVKAKTKKVTWKSSTPGIISVSKSGRITAKKTGTAKITARYNGQKITFTVKGTTKKTSVPISKTDGSVVITYHMNMGDDSIKDSTAYKCPYVGYSFREENGVGENQLFENLSRDGYIFDGWYTSSKEGEKKEIGTKVQDDTELWAHWARSAHVSVYSENPAGDDSDFSTPIFEFDVKIDDTLSKGISYSDQPSWKFPALTADGYTLKRWYLLDDKSVTSEYKSVYRCRCDCGDFDSIQEAIDHMDAEPEWEFKYMSFSLHNYAGPYSTTDYTIPDAATVDLQSDTKAIKDRIDMDFWKEDEAIELSICGDWEPKKVTVTFDAGRGKINGQSQKTVQVDYGRGLGSCGYTPEAVLDGYHFLGWALEGSEDGVIEWYDMKPKITEPFTLYACYRSLNPN